MKLIFAAIMLAALMFGAGVARADSQDDYYLRMLADAGVGRDATRDQLVAIGHTVCDLLGDGVSPAKVAKDLYDAPANLSEHDVITLVAAAVFAY